MPDSSVDSLRVGQHCSVINNGILYVYSQQGMRSLPLSKGAEWSNLPSGVRVSGAQCVLTHADNPVTAALYIVGGISASPSYTGLQKYTFATKKWETITASSADTQNRQHHGATYLPAIDSILVYAGQQQDVGTPLSSQTFSISLADYNIISYVSNGVPPVTAPNLLTFNQSHALMVGGGVDNKAVFLFGNGMWSDLGTTLESGLGSRDSVKCTLVSGEDKSKVLEIFDMSVAPNKVTQIALWTGSGPANPGTVLGAKSRKRKRDLTLANWPAYSSKNAPKEKRTGFSLATDNDSGLAVISGGSTDNPIVIFNQQKNSWVNSNSIFGNQDPLIVHKHDSSSTSSASSTTTSSSASQSSTIPPTSSASTSATAVPGINPPDDDDHSKTLTVLGATLGTIFGLAALLVLILLLLRWRREKQKRNAGTYINEKEQNRLSFADQGTEFMHTAGGSVGHKYTQSINESSTSLNIIAGKTDKKLGKHMRNGGTLGSDSSTAGLVVKKSSPLGLNDSVEMSQMRSTPSKGKGGAATGLRKPPAAPTDPVFGRGPGGSNSRPGTSGSVTAGGAEADNSRSSGWSKYFSNDPSTSAIAARKESISSTYTRGSAVTHPSQNPQPLELNLGPRFGEGALVDATPVSSTGLSVLDNGKSDLSRAASAKSTKSTAASSTWDEFNFETHGGTATTGTWTPVSDNPNWVSHTAAQPKPGHQATMSVASSIYSRAPQSYYPGNDSSKNLYYKSGTSTNYFPMPPKGGAPVDENRDSSVTLWPKADANRMPPVPELYAGPTSNTTASNAPKYAAYGAHVDQKKAPVGEDVSWLSLK